MAGVWTVKFGSLTISTDDNAAFSLTRTPAYNEAGGVESVQTTVSIEGDVRKSTPILVTDRVIDEWLAQATEGEKTLTLELDGVPRLTITPSAAVNGPRVTTVEAIPDEGAGESHWRVRMVVDANQTAAQAEGDTTDEAKDVSDIKIEVIVVKNTLGQVFKKIWRVRAKGTTHAKARAFVKKFKPVGVKVQEEEAKGFTENEALITWVYEGQRTGTILRIDEEPPLVVGAGENWIEALKVAAPTVNIAPDPGLIRARNKAGRAVFRGVTVAYSPLIAPPAPHLSVGPGIKRMQTEASRRFVVKENRELGTFELPWEEVYIITSPNAVGSINHGDHFQIVYIGEPSDGKAATFKL